MRSHFLRLLFFSSVVLSCSTPKEITRHQTKEYVFSDTINTSIDSSIDVYVRPYRQQMEKEMNVVLAESVSTLERGNPESKLGNFMADACLNIARKRSTDKIDFCFFNSGGLRKALPQGPITKGDVFQLMPFENELVVLSCDGDHVENLLNFIASKGGAPVGGIRFDIKEGKPSNIRISDEAFDKQKTYKVLTSDYLANGGDSFFFLSDLKRENLNLKVRDALIQFLQETTAAGKKIDIVKDGRITNVQ